MQDKTPLELNPDFNYALDAIDKEGKNMFITGRAGTGKSTLLQLFKNTTKKRVVILAPTGIAALNVGGQTIHSFFKFPAKPLQKKDLKKVRRRKIYHKMEVLVIDEISMVRADLLDNIDLFLRINRENMAPFGGVQVVLFGDLFQLPPIVSTDIERQLFTSYYASPYFFSAKVFEEYELEMLELRKVYRQDNRHFLRLLEGIRLNRLDYEDMEDLNDRYLPDFKPEDFYITLSARNATVDAINQSFLDSIPMPGHFYPATIKGSFPQTRFPTEANLQLKLNAQVMFVKNDPDKRFVNGTIGKVVKLENEEITVMVEAGEDAKKYIKVTRVDWDIMSYELNPNDENEIIANSVGTFTQFPIKLAWAITIHKSQGKTFDKVIIDMGRGAFEHGQTYVAISRCRTLDGIVLKQPLRPRDIKTDIRIVEFYQQYF